MDVLGLPAANAVNEVREMISGGAGRRSGFDVLGQPRFVRVITVDTQIAIRSIEEVADRICFCIDRPDGPDASERIGSFLRRRRCRSGESRSWYSAAFIGSRTDLRFVIGNPWPNFQLHHFSFSIWAVEIIRGVQHIGSFLIVVKDKMPAHGRDHRRKANPEAPARDVDFMDCLVADFSISCIPDPMPVVVKTIFGEWLQRRRPGPQIVVNAGGNGLRSYVANRAAPFVTQRASEIDVADHAIVKALNGLDHAGIRTGLAAVLANAIVL